MLHRPIITSSSSFSMLLLLSFASFVIKRSKHPFVNNREPSQTLQNIKYPKMALVVLLSNAVNFGRDTTEMKWHERQFRVGKWKAGRMPWGEIWENGQGDFIDWKLSWFEIITFSLPTKARRREWQHWDDDCDGLAKFCTQPKKIQIEPNLR